MTSFVREHLETYGFHSIMGLHMTNPQHWIPQSNGKGSDWHIHSVVQEGKAEEVTEGQNSQLGILSTKHRKKIYP